MRKLALHASALNDEEYELYTESLKEIVLGDCDEGDSSTRGEGDDVYYERMVVGVREARAWLRGRYSSLAAGVIDKILKLFSPSLAVSDTLSGEEFFAALRLVIHAMTGKEPERSLVFVQAHPTSSDRRVATEPLHLTQKRPADLPLPPSRRPNVDSVPPSPTRPDTQNPFFSSHSHPQPPLHPSQRQSPSTPASTTEFSSSALKSHTGNNPFISRPSSSKSEDGNSHAHKPKLPPLPPRKPVISTNNDTASISGISTTTSKSQPPPPPPRHRSTRSRTERSLSPSKTDNPPPKPPKPIQLAYTPSSTSTTPPVFPTKPSASTSNSTTASTHSILGSKLGSSPNVFKPPPLSNPLLSSTMPPSTHNTSPLIKHSLQASKVAHAVKKAEENLEKERVMRVLKSSSASVYGESGSGNGHGGGSATGSVIGRVGVGGIGRTTSESGSEERERKSQGPPLPKRRYERQQVQQPSPPMSTSSLEQVVLAGSGEGERERWEGERDRGGDERVEGREKERERVKSDPPPVHPGRRSSYHHSIAQANASSSGISNTIVVSPFEAVYGSGMNYEPDVIGGSNSNFSSMPFTPFDATATNDTSNPESPTIQNHRVWRSKSLHHPSSPRPPFSSSTSHPHSIATSISNSSTVSNSTSTPTTSTGAPLIPPPRRKRPESVQVLPSSSSSSTSTIGAMFGIGLKGIGGATGYGNASGGKGMGSRSPSRTRDVNGRVGVGVGGGMSHNRRSSLSVAPSYSSSGFGAGPNANVNVNSSGRGHGDGVGGVGVGTSGESGSGSPIATMQLSDSFHRTLASFQPKLDQARYKAEAGLSRRGYIKTGGAGSVLGGGVLSGGRGNAGGGRREDRESREGLMSGGVGCDSEDEELEETRERLKRRVAEEEDKRRVDSMSRNANARMRGKSLGEVDDSVGGMMTNRNDYIMKNTNTNATNLNTHSKKTRKRSGLGPSYDSSDGEDDDGGGSDAAFVDAPEGMGYGNERRGRYESRGGGFESFEPIDPFMTSGRSGRGLDSSGMHEGWRPL